MVKDKRERYYKWTFVIYPGDSLPADYENIISNWHIPVLLSPIHDKDLNGDTSEKKKHIHCLIDFTPVKKSFDDVQDLISILGGTVPQRVQNEKGLVRYFTHIDNPEKVSYNITDIKSFSGYEYLDFFTNSSDINCAYYSIENYIRTNKIDNLVILMTYLEEQQEYDLMTFVRRNTIYISNYLNGMYQLNHKKQKITFEKETD